MGASVWAALSVGVVDLLLDAGDAPCVDVLVLVVQRVDLLVPLEL